MYALPLGLNTVLTIEHSKCPYQLQKARTFIPACMYNHVYSRLGELYISIQRNSFQQSVMLKVVALNQTL